MIREWIEQAAARQGRAPYLQDGSGPRVLTYTGLRATARRWAGALEAAGIPPGAGVTVRAADPVEYAARLLAIVAAGRVAVPLDPAAPPAGLAGALAVARPVAAAADEADGLPPGLALVPPPAGPGAAGPAPLTRRAAARATGPGPGHGGIFLCTSGTTGTPKGILLGGAQLAHVAASVATCHRLGPADHGYCPLPLFHVNAEVVGLLATLRAQACLTVAPRFSRRGFWDAVARQRITWINAVPAIITLLALDPPGRLPRSVRFARSASAPLPRAALARFEAAFGVPVIETYGMTEAASMITANPLDGPRKPGSAGLPAGAEVQVVDGPPGHPGRPCPPGVVGRVRIRGRGVITGYAAGGRPGAIGPGGWLDTGDLGYTDPDGYLFLAGRADDVINRGGEKIYPREIEEVLLALPGVAAAAVTGAPDEVLGQRPVAYVVPAAGAGTGPGGSGLAGALHEACRSRLPRPKQPAAIYLVDQLPLGATGKLARHRLPGLRPSPAAAG